MPDKSTSPADTDSKALASIHAKIRAEISITATENASKYCRQFQRDLWRKANQIRRSDKTGTLSDRHIDKAHDQIRENWGRGWRDLVGTMFNVGALATFGVGTAFIPTSKWQPLGWALAIVGFVVMVLSELYRREYF